MKILKFFLILFVLVTLAPVIAFSGYGFAHDRDVFGGLRTIWFEVVLNDHAYLHTYPGILSDADSAPAIETTAATDDVFKPVQWLGDLENPGLMEASGLAHSNLDKDVFFAINDSGNEPRLFAMGRRGEDLGSWRVDYKLDHDFEDLASFEWQGKAYLLIADVGDNLAWRRDLAMLIVEEPDLANLNPQSVIKIAWSFGFDYPGGPRDSEAVAVDADQGVIIVASKRTVPAEIFELPLKPEGARTTAKKIAELTGIPQPTTKDLAQDPKWGYSRAQPTAMDIFGRRAIVITYKDAYYYERAPFGSWAEAFGRTPDRIPLPAMYGLESGAFFSRARYFLITGERENGIARSPVYEGRL